MQLVSQGEFLPPPVLFFQTASVEDACDIESFSEDSDRPHGPWLSLAVMTHLFGIDQVQRDMPNLRQPTNLTCGKPRPDDVRALLRNHRDFWNLWSISAQSSLTFRAGALKTRPTSSTTKIQSPIQGLRLVCSLFSIPARALAPPTRSPSLVPGRVCLSHPTMVRVRNLSVRERLALSPPSVSSF